MPPGSNYYCALAARGMRPLDCVGELGTVYAPVKLLLRARGQGDAPAGWAACKPFRPPLNRGDGGAFREMGGRRYTAQFDARMRGMYTLSGLGRARSRRGGEHELHSPPAAARWRVHWRAPAATPAVTPVPLFASILCYTSNIELAHYYRKLLFFCFTPISVLTATVCCPSRKGLARRGIHTHPQAGSEAGRTNTDTKMGFA